jgi:hypothetical protein
MRCVQSNTNHLLMCLSPLPTLPRVRAHPILDSTVALPQASATPRPARMLETNSDASMGFPTAAKRSENPCAF